MVTRSFKITTNDAVTGNECGMRVSLPYACRSWGATFVGLPYGRGDLTLYSGTSDTIVRRASWPDLGTPDGTPRAATFYWPTPVDLEPGAYTITVRPTDPSNKIIKAAELNVPPFAGWMTAYGYGPNDGLVYRVNEGAWSSVSATRLMPIALEIQQLTSVSSGRRRPLLLGA